MTDDRPPSAILDEALEKVGLSKGERHQVKAEAAERGALAEVGEAPGARVDLGERARDEAAESRIEGRLGTEAERLLDRWRNHWSDRLEGVLDRTLIADVFEAEPGRFSESDPFGDLERLLGLPPFRASSAAIAGLRAECRDSGTAPWLCWRMPNDRIRVFRAGPFVRYRRRLEEVFVEGLWDLLRSRAPDAPEADAEQPPGQQARNDLTDALRPFVEAWREGDLDDDRWSVVVDAAAELQRLERRDGLFLAPATLQAQLYRIIRRGWLLEGNDWWDRLRTAVDGGAVEVDDRGAWTFDVAAEDTTEVGFAADALARALDGETPPIPPPTFARLVPGKDGSAVGFHLAVNDPWPTRGSVDAAVGDARRAVRNETSVRNIRERDRELLEAVAAEENEHGGIDPGDRRPHGFWPDVRERLNDSREDPDDEIDEPWARVRYHQLTSDEDG